MHWGGGRRSRGSWSVAVAAVGAVALTVAVLPGQALAASPPSAPAISRNATAAHQSATVSWTAPGNNGGSPITGYTVTPYVGYTPRPSTTFASTATTQTVTGLVNGTTYRFRVQAINAIGTSGHSTVTNPVTPAAVPGVPTGVIASAADEEATVSWTAPGDDGGSAISGYLVTPHVAGAPQNPVAFETTDTTQVVTGLTNGTAYTFTVAATNAVGTGPASVPSTIATPQVLAPVAVAAGSAHTCALADNGSVRCWGSNNVGQLGNGSTTTSSGPVTVTGLTGVITISAGASHTCALLDDGTARCWGFGFYGQLGNGTSGYSTSSSTPVTVTGLTGATAISAGGHHTCALLDDGTARCWGDGSSGPLGNGSTSDSATPVTVTGLTGATAISAGGHHTCALLDDGTTRCWGYNSTGQLGNGTTTSSSTAVTVTGLTGATSISAGGHHTCALLGDGTARCWGYGGYGQLGRNSTTNATTPGTSVILTGAAAITTGATHTCALIEDGTARCWGNNEYGAVGNGTLNRARTPVTVPGLTGATAISAGGYLDGGSHTCAVVGDGTARCWGSDDHGQIGDGATGFGSPTPVTVASLTGATAIAAGPRQSCAVGEDGVARCWGTSGDFLNGTATTHSNTPVAVPGLTGMVAVAAGGAYDGRLSHACAVLDDGTARCWGDNRNGQLGNGTTTDSATPVTVAGLTGAVAITAGGDSEGDSHTCALIEDGTARCWGSGVSGQLGHGANPTRSATPVSVTGLSGAVAITAGALHTCAVIDDGTVRCWGYEVQRVLEDGTIEYANTPEPVAGLTGATAVAAGRDHTCALIGDGTARCWGYGESGRLGNATITSSGTILTVTGLTGATAISASAYHTCALIDDGTARCWGFNSNGQLGDGTTDDAVTLVSVAGLAGATAIAAGGGHTCALVDDGTARCWGGGFYGQLGDGSAAFATVPTPVVDL